MVYLPSNLGPLHEGSQDHLFTASRLDGPKRVALLIRAMAHVPGDIPLLIAGTGPEEQRLRRLAGDDSRIRFLGFVDDRQLIDLYANALAVAFVPEDEDYGLITLEAMGCGSPVVTCTDSGGPTELVADGVTGLVAEPDPTSLGRAMARLVGQPHLAASLGRAAKRRAARITWDDAIRSLLDDRRRSTGSARSISLVKPVAGRPTSPGKPASNPNHGTGSARRKRPKIVVTATFRVDPPRGGGQLRCLRLYGALARHADVEIVCLVDPLHPAGTTRLGPGMAPRRSSRAHPPTRRSARS